MNNNVVIRNGENNPISPEEMLKATSLLYIKEALVKERFEDCAELIQVAKEFGAEKREISRVIVGYIRGLKVGRQNGAYKKRKGRRRF